VPILIWHQPYPGPRQRECVPRRLRRPWPVPTPDRSPPGSPRRPPAARSLRLARTPSRAPGPP